MDEGKKDRIAGALVGLAAGDALGAPYEFTTPGPGADIQMVAGAGWEAGEWSDDTCQAIGIAEVAARGRLAELEVGQRFFDWYDSHPKDIGISTRAVFDAAGNPAGLKRAARRYFDSNPRGGAGNGSLMRTSPVALANLGDDDAIADWARRLSLLTHGDPLAAEACVLWCIGIDRAIREERLDGVRDGLALLPDRRGGWWEARLDEAEQRNPHEAYSAGNGFVVTALQAAWAVITQTAVPDGRASDHLRECLREAVRVGQDTDTVAAIAGQLLGARWGAGAVPEKWRQQLHGWPGWQADELAAVAPAAAGLRAGATD